MMGDDAGTNTLLVCGSVETSAVELDGTVLITMASDSGSGGAGRG
jgi:hypothetical protein